MTVSLDNLLKWLILTLIFPLIFLNGWLALRFFKYFQPLVTIFVLASLLAFILNYPVGFLQKRGVKRNQAVLLVFVPTLLVLIALGVTLVPIVLEEIHEIAHVFPQWIDSSNQKLQSLQDLAASRRFPLNFRNLAIQVVDRLPDELQFFVDKVFSIVLDTIDSISEGLLIVVLSFYLLLDGERLWNGIFQKFPSSISLQIQKSLQLNFQNYFIGQIALAALVGFSMTLLFLILKVPFGLLFGLGMGLVSIVPFGDVFSLGVITLLIASHDFWLAVKVLAIAIVIDQLIDQAIAPRLLGSFTGLRPIWVLVSLLLGTYIAGILGLLVAVPVASFIKSMADGCEVPTSAYADNAVQLASTESTNTEPSPESSAEG